MSRDDNLVSTLRSIAGRLDAQLAAIDPIVDAARELQHVADRIKEAVGAPFRPAWADPTVAAHEVASRHRSAIAGMRDELRKLVSVLES